MEIFLYLCQLKLQNIITYVMISKIEQLKAEISALEATTAEAVEQLRIRYLSKKGEISALMNDFRTVPADQKRELGQKLNELKTFATEKLATLKETLADNADKEKSNIDLTRTATPLPLVTRHPLSLVKN